MELHDLSNAEIALRIARALRAWRVDADGGDMSQHMLARESRMALTSIKRFERTGGITLRNLVALFRALDLLERLEGLVPEASGRGPLALLKAQKAQRGRRPAPRAKAALTKGSNSRRATRA